MFCKVSGLSMVLVLTACGMDIGPKSEQHTSSQIDMTNVTAISMSGDDGDLTISPSTSTAGSVEFTKQTSRFFAGTGDCHSDQHVDGTTLYINVSKDPNAGCEVETVVFAPPSVTIDASLDNGDMHINHMQNNVKATNDNGDVNVSMDPPANGNLVCDGTMTTSNGDVNVSLSYQPTSGTLSLTSDNGSAVVNVPSGTAYSLASQVDNGKLEKDVPDTSSAPFKISLKTDNGKLKVGQN